PDHPGVRVRGAVRAPDPGAAARRAVPHVPRRSVVDGRVHSFDLSVGVDGPGTRFVVFLAGCPLRCRYCHSPDTWYMRTGQLTTVDAMLTEVRRYRRFL